MWWQVFLVVKCGAKKCLMVLIWPHLLLMPVISWYTQPFQLPVTSASIVDTFPCRKEQAGSCAILSFQFRISDERLYFSSALLNQKQVGSSASFVIHRPSRALKVNNLPVTDATFTHHDPQHRKTLLCV